MPLEVLTAKQHRDREFRRDRPHPNTIDGRLCAPWGRTQPLRDTLLSEHLGREKPPCTLA